MKPCHACGEECVGLSEVDGENLCTECRDGLQAAELDGAALPYESEDGE